MAGGEFCLILLAQLRGVDLIYGVPEAFAFLGEVVRVAAQLGEFFAHRAEIAPCGGVGGRINLSVGV